MFGEKWNEELFSFDWRRKLKFPNLIIVLEALLELPTYCHLIYLVLSLIDLIPSLTLVSTLSTW